MNILHLPAAAALLCGTLLPAPAPACSAESGSSRVPLLELYTSEGCDSCPPADQWFSQLLQRSLAPQRVLPLAFHVDYWDRLGWPDPYARPAYSDRQREAARRNRARVVYTPQLLLDGADYRRHASREDLAERLASINRSPPGARIRLAAAPGTDTQQLHVRIELAAAVAPGTARAYVAVYEHGLSGRVTAGENRGRLLQHDAVVRHLTPALRPDAGGVLDARIALRREANWKTAGLGIAVFVQDISDGRTLQALTLPWCDAATAVKPASGI